jgi:hypothetical protein
VVAPGQGRAQKASQGPRLLVEQLDWKGNTDPHFKDNHYLEPMPVADTRSEGCTDRWIVYGKVDGEQLFTAKELTVDPRRCTIKDRAPTA